MEGLTEGRIVHFVMPDGQHRGAIITKVWDQGGCCNLSVFADWSNDKILPATGLVWETSVLFSEEKTPDTWHWIERT